jgi:hypothetical protein
MLLATALAACSPFYVDWDKHTIRQASNNEIKEAAIPSPAASRPDSVTPHHQSASIHPRKHKPATSPPDMEEMTIEPDTTENSQAPSDTSTISMAAPGDSSSSAEKVIEATGQRLAHFNRNRLHGSTRATFDQAYGFLNQGKQALAEKDYVAASGFAQKASVLADKLQATVTSR